ncbi:hypothetical protein HK099_001065 [Clydaea vesicula]|uniref:DUF4200 domain-containing protein n=1 Tax=Clydaea vesicula TaxID=447962 RepID=A0AAD5U7A3_9FUNG|nr:hypothetical protein HK099_001065 [Clydaea vesicula]
MIAVEQLSKINQNNNDTFVTQRGGKIINDGTRKLGTMLFKTNEALFENNRTLQSTLLLQKKKEMHQVQQLLEKKRIEFAKRMEECREKQEELKVKQKQIRERVFKFEKFLKENDAKRQRANVKAQTEKKLREQKEQELLGLQKQLMEESKNSKNILTMLPHINDILMRHKTLVETNEDLMSMLQSFQDEIEKEQKGLQLSIKNKNDEILVYNSTLGFQQKKLDKMKQNCANLEQKQEEKDRTGKERVKNKEFFCFIIPRCEYLEKQNLL